jgi:hypothetical protein
MQTSASTLNVTGSVAGSTTITVYEYGNGSSAPYASAQVTLYFGTGTTTTGSLSCTLSHPAANYPLGAPVSFTIATNTGEMVYITNWINVGLSWTSQPPFPLVPPVAVSYNYYPYGQRFVSVQMWAQSASGVQCNGGAPLQDTVYLY